MDLIHILLQKGILQQEQLSGLEQAIKSSGASQEALLANAGIALEDILKAKGEYYNIPTRILGSKTLSFQTLRLIPEESARHYGFVPLGIVDSALEVGVTDPDNLAARDALSFISGKLGMPYKVFLITESDFEKVLQQYKGLSGEVGTALTELETDAAEEKKGQQGKRFTSIEEETINDISSEAVTEDAPITKIVATILRHASEQRASDIHIEPFPDESRIRFRIDGVLITSITLPAKIHPAVAARIKVLSNMRLDEKRRPQDGRFSARISGEKVDFRVSTFPTYYGEKVEMRILGTSAMAIKLEDLGFSDHNREMIRAAIKKPYGMILISGPTGSGKSTTLYAILNEIDRDKQNVLSLEDPVEYTIPGVSQSQVRPEIGYTFATGLRTTLRQDPNVIMVGEIRDAETADLAVQAALTGHLVLSTIHTNNAIGIVPRLLDMKIEPYLIPPVLILGMAQRLVRTLPPNGGKKVPVEGSIQTMIEKEFSDLPAQFKDEIPPMKEIYRLHPTPEFPTGTKGRVAVSELYEMTPELERAIVANKPEQDLSAIVRKYGMLTMKEDAIIKAARGIIPLEEINTLGGGFDFSDTDADHMPAPTPTVLGEDIASEDLTDEVQL